jgi:hypothetical protein
MNSCFPCKGNVKETVNKLQRDFPEMPPSNIQKIGLYAISRETELLTKKRKMKLFLLFILFSSFTVAIHWTFCIIMFV